MFASQVERLSQFGAGASRASVNRRGVAQGLFRLVEPPHRTQHATFGDEKQEIGAPPPHRVVRGGSEAPVQDLQCLAVGPTLVKDRRQPPDGD